MTSHNKVSSPAGNSERITTRVSLKLIPTVHILLLFLVVYMRVITGDLHRLYARIARFGQIANAQDVEYVSILRNLDLCVFSLALLVVYLCFLLFKANLWSRNVSLFLFLMSIAVLVLVFFPL